MKVYEMRHWEAVRSEGLRRECVRSEGVTVTPGIVRGEEVGPQWGARCKGSRDCGDACSVTSEGVGSEGDVTCGASFPLPSTVPFVQESWRRDLGAEGGKEGGREREREGGREGERERGREGEWEGEREGEREGGREGGREGWREGGRERDNYKEIKL